MIDIAPGFTVTDGRITEEVVFDPVHLATLRAEMAAEIRKANEARGASVPQVQELAALIERNVRLCQAYLNDFNRNYNILIRLKNAAAAIVLTKTGDRFNVAVRQEPADTKAYDLVFTISLFVSAARLANPMGIRADNGRLRRNMAVRRPASRRNEPVSGTCRCSEEAGSAPPGRYGVQPRWLYEVKSRIKRAVGRKNETLYDLLTWTVFDDEVTPGHRAADADRALGRY